MRIIISKFVKYNLWIFLLVFELRIWNSGLNMYLAEAAGQAAAYLRAGVGARALGLGNAGTVAAKDASAAYWNPAALILLPEQTSIASQTAVLGLKRSWNFLSYAHRDESSPGKYFAYGLSWINFSAGSDIEARTANRPEPDYIFRDSQNTFILSAASGSRHEQFALGLNIKFLIHSLADESGSGFGLDLGVWHSIFENTQWGLVFQDVYSTVTWSDWHQDRVPLFMRLGIVQQFYEKRFLLTGDLGIEFFHAANTFRDTHYHFGAEYFIIPAIALRAGLDSGRLAAGVGWCFMLEKLGRWDIDYAITGERFPEEGLTHFISLNVGY